jgi:hypothetical protein
MVMYGKYNNDSEIRDLVKAFEGATVSRDDWKHAEHIVVALYYLASEEYDAATAKMRDGIFNLLTKGFNVDLSKEMPYHETLTVFWMQTINDFLCERQGRSLAENAAEAITIYDKDYPLRFYTRELLFSDEARSGYVEPDLVQS